MGTARFRPWEEGGAGRNKTLPEFAERDDQGAGRGTAADCAGNSPWKSMPHVRRLATGSGKGKEGFLAPGVKP